MSAPYEIPPEAEEIGSVVSEAECLGCWRDPRNGDLYIAGYHHGPSGEVLFKISLDGYIKSGNDIAWFPPELVKGVPWGTEKHPLIKHTVTESGPQRWDEALLGFRLW